MYFGVDGWSGLGIGVCLLILEHVEPIAGCRSDRIDDSSKRECGVKLVLYHGWVLSHELWLMPRVPKGKVPGGHFVCNGDCGL